MLISTVYEKCGHAVTILLTFPTCVCVWPMGGGKGVGKGVGKLRVSY